MIDGYEKHTCTECETMFISNEELNLHHIIDHGVALAESTVDWSDITPDDQVEESDDGSFTSNGKPITFSDEDTKQAKEYLSETAQQQKIMVASEQRLKMARDQIKATNLDTDEFYEQILGESNGQDFSSGAGTINPLDTPKFKYSKNKKLADTINTKGYNPNPNAGLYDNKQFKEGGVHLEDPLAKEDFEVSFYGREADVEEAMKFDKDGNIIKSVDKPYSQQKIEHDDTALSINDDPESLFESRVKAREWELPAELQGLIPNSGSVNDPDLEELRKAMNTYYEVSNNGGGNWYDGADGDTKSLMQNYNLSNTERLEAFHVDNENQYDGYGNDIEPDQNEEDRLMRSSMSELETIINQLIEKAKGKRNDNNWNSWESFNVIVKDSDGSVNTVKTNNSDGSIKVYDTREEAQKALTYYEVDHPNSVTLKNSNESKASEGFSSSLDFDEPYPDPECKICGKVMINVWGDTRDAQDWGKIEQAIQEHYIGVHGDDATTQELSDNEIMQQNIIFWGESKATEDFNKFRCSNCSYQTSDQDEAIKHKNENNGHDIEIYGKGEFGDSGTNQYKESKASEVNDYTKDDVFDYLFDLQESGDTNMMGANPYVEREFPYLNKNEVDEIVVEWMSNWDSIAKRMGKESKANEWESGNKNVHENFHIIIKNRKTGEIGSDMTATSLREAETIMSGASINMNHDDWEIVIEQGESKASERDIYEKHGLLTSQADILDRWLEGSDSPTNPKVSDLPYSILAQLQRLQDSNYEVDGDQNFDLDSTITSYIKDKSFESKASETDDTHTRAWDEKYGQDLCPICKDSGNCNSMVFHAKLWNDVKKSDESLKADWDESGYEEKYSWLKDLGVDDAFKYSNMTLYELPEEVWQKVNKDYVDGFKQMVAESYTPNQQNVVETVEEKIISRKLDGTPVGQIARELVLWNELSEENATKIVGEVEPSDNDMVAKTLFNKRYSECNESEIQEMELYDA